MINKDLLAKGLKCTVGYEPISVFRFEQGVSIRKCEIMGGVTFGMFSYINSGFIRSSVVIGRYCSIGRNVTIGSGAHDFFIFFNQPIF
jgi:UDP-3-O-[3-hydroxymyristoyl] glucosamine N-acyltransferase